MATITLNHLWLQSSLALDDKGFLSTVHRNVGLVGQATRVVVLGEIVAIMVLADDQVPMLLG